MLKDHIGGVEIFCYYTLAVKWLDESIIECATHPDMNRRIQINMCETEKDMNNQSGVLL
jgi:hypothetical protein